MGLVTDSTSVASKAKIVAFPQWQHLHEQLTGWGLAERIDRFPKDQRMFTVVSVGDGTLMYFPISARLHKRFGRMEREGEMLAEQAVKMAGSVPVTSLSVWQMSAVRAYRIAIELSES